MVRELRRRRNQRNANVLTLLHEVDGLLVDGGAFFEGRCAWRGCGDGCVQNQRVIVMGSGRSEGSSQPKLNEHCLSAQGDLRLLASWSDSQYVWNCCGGTQLILHICTESTLCQVLLLTVKLFST